MTLPELQAEIKSIHCELQELSSRSLALKKRLTCLRNIEEALLIESYPTEKIKKLKVSSRNRPQDKVEEIAKLFKTMSETDKEEAVKYVLAWDE